MRLVVFWLPILTNALVVPVNKRTVATRRSAATLKRTEAPPLDVKNEAPPVDDATAAETDRSHGFAEGPSVAFWQKYAPPAEGGIGNLRAAAAKALQSGAKGADAMRYYGYHLARATFFAGQGAAGVIAYQASASSAPVWKSTSELGRVDGVGRPKFDFHTGQRRTAATPRPPSRRKARRGRLPLNYLP